jgi:hypothetical protein
MNVGQKTRRNVLAKREANGRIQRDPPLPAASEVRRLRDAAISGMRDPTWGTELGRLYLVGKITATMFAAGKRWGELSSKYSQALCSPSPEPKAICFDRSGGESPDPDSYEGRREARRHERAVTSFIDAWGALKALKDNSVSERIVRALCERNEMLAGHESLLALTRGLAELAGFWGLTDSRKSVSDRQS